MIKIKMLQVGLQLFLSCFGFCPTLNTLWVTPVSSSENVLPDRILCVSVITYEFITTHTIALYIHLT